MKYAFIRDMSHNFFLFPHMELRLMFCGQMVVAMGTVTLNFLSSE